MGKTKICWCDWVFNPVWGCLKNPPCPYCYARKIAHRFGKTEDEKAFKPTWKQDNFEKTFPKKPARIFVGSMSDIASWDDSWISKVLDKIEENPQHTFLFLTKKPECYRWFDRYIPENCLLGATTTNESEIIGSQPFLSNLRHAIFLSIEPILERIRPDCIDKHIIEWIILGAETGNRKGRVIPELSWIQNIVDYAQNYSIPVWLKENLRGIWPGELVQELPNGGKT